MDKVAGYIRVSSPAQAAEGESLNTQKTQIEQFVKMKNWTLTKIYEDAGLSGGKAETRPAFQEMIRDAERRAFEGIVFTKLSRFARSASDFLRYRDRLRKYDVYLFSIKEGLDPQSKVGQLLMGFLAMVAEWDKENIREQMEENKIARW
jgi:site-specific DNA recombinase